MILVIVYRILYAIPIALAVSFICFLLVHIAPGDPINGFVPPDAPPEIVAQVRLAYGLDKPLIVQFGLWLLHVCSGDLGHSLSTGRAVTTEIGAAMGKTITLALFAAVPAFLIGCVLGGVAAFWRGSWIDHTLGAIAVATLSIPHYWLGIVFVILFSVLLPWFPAMGAGPGAESGWLLDWPHLQYLVLPAATLAMAPVGIVTRTVRAIAGDILAQEFVVTLQAKGMRRRRILLHVIKNAAPNTLTVLGLQFGYLMGGSILVETVFDWPGTGSLLNNAIFQRDIPVLQGTVLVLALFFVALNLVVDLLQALLDPRITRSHVD